VLVTQSAVSHARSNNTRVSFLVPSTGLSGPWARVPCLVASGLGACIRESGKPVRVRPLEFIRLGTHHVQSSGAEERASYIFGGW
jgi:hypothetical protein